MIHILAVAIRLFSIGLFVYALNMGVGVISMASIAENYGLVGFVLAGSLLIISVLLWFFPFTALASLTRGFQVELTDDQNYEFNEVADFLVVLVGIYLLYHVVSDAAYWILILQLTSASNYPIEITPDQKALVGATIVEAILAVWLILGRKGLINFIKAARFGGLK